MCNYNQFSPPGMVWTPLQRAVVEAIPNLAHEFMHRFHPCAVQLYFPAGHGDTFE